MLGNLPRHGKSPDIAWRSSIILSAQEIHVELGMFSVRPYNSAHAMANTGDARIGDGVRPIHICRLTVHIRCVLGHPFAGGEVVKEHCL